MRKIYDSLSFYFLQRLITLTWFRFLKFCDCNASIINEKLPARQCSFAKKLYLIQEVGIVMILKLLLWTHFNFVIVQVFWETIVSSKYLHFWIWELRPSDENVKNHSSPPVEHCWKCWEVGRTDEAYNILSMYSLTLGTVVLGPNCRPQSLAKSINQPSIVKASSCSGYTNRYR